METLITQEYEFAKNSLNYGQFLIECYEGCSEIKIEDAPYNHRRPGMHHVIITVPDQLAVVLKLRFGAFLRVRPEPSELARKLKTRFDMPISKDSYLIDYTTNRIKFEDGDWEILD